MGGVRPLHLHGPGGDPGRCKYDPEGSARYHEDSNFLAAGGSRTGWCSDARTLVRALGYDMNSIEFAIRDGMPYAIDFMNPAPDMDIYSLTPHLLRLGRDPHGGPGDQAGAGWAEAGAAAGVGGAVCGGQAPVTGSRTAFRVPREEVDASITPPDGQLIAGCVPGLQQG